jgi:hypothetical protein
MDAAKGKYRGTEREYSNKPIVTCMQWVGKHIPATHVLNRTSIAR